MVLIRYLHPADHNPAKIRKVDKDFAEELDLKDKKLPLKIRCIHEIEKRRILSPLVFLVLKIRKNF